MNDETLKQLLQRADAGAADALPSVSAGDLLAAVQCRRRRTVGMRAVAASAVLALVTVGVRQMFDRRPDSGADWSLKRPVRITDGDDLRRDLARLEREADMHLRIVRGLTEQQPAAEGIGTLEHVSLVQAEAARSAALSWQYATLVETDLANPAAARREYERVVERFPGTEWANLAHVSLQRLSQSKDPSSL